jgi:hypothetical protein
MSEEIKLLIDFLDSEMSRFWTRFNIFAGIQIAAAIGMIQYGKLSRKKKIFTRGALLLMVSISLIGALAIYRGHDLQRALVDRIQALEEKSASQPVVRPVLDDTMLPHNLVTCLCVVFAVICLIYWIVVWRRLELRWRCRRRKSKRASTGS